jgi:formylglycine-generating enzyme required for sulfatase activity
VDGPLIINAKGDMAIRRLIIPIQFIIVMGCLVISGHAEQPQEKSPIAWGLYDMQGNVQEWCRDWFGVNPYDEVTDPEGPTSGSYRVMRGGVWYSPARDCRSASRFGSPPHCKFRHIGFRLCKTP